MPELIDLLRELRRRVAVDVDVLRAELDAACTDYRFGWQQRGKAKRAELAELLQLAHAVDTFVEALD